MLRILTLIALLACPPVTADAAEYVVRPGPDALETAINMAQAGDTLRLWPGTYFGPIVITKPLTLIGEKATIDGRGVGSVITVDVADVILTGLTITGSGSKGKGLDAGVSLTKKASRAIVRGNRILDNLIGVDIHGAEDSLVTGNVIEGRQDHRMNDRGNGVYVWNAPGASVIGNDIRWGKDGVFVNTSHHNTFSGNRFRDLRFAVHYMFAHDSTVSDNISQGNHLGFAVMNSDRVEVTGNISIGDRDHGIMLNYTNNSRIAGNWVQDGGEKCVFIYNAHKNQIEDNRLERCQIGIHFTAGSERNAIAGNAFVGNRTQVKYAGTKWVDWSVEGRGNYWSNFAAYDIDGDGIAEGQFRPNDAVDHVLWTQPAARLLLGSPAIQLVRWSQSAFPALLPGGVVDSHPLMTATMPENSAWDANNGQ
jgi:nitrous oxidase accessory protein